MFEALSDDDGTNRRFMESAYDGEEGVCRPHVDSVIWVGFFDYFIIMSFIIIST